MFNVDILVHGTVFAVKVDRAKLQFMISVHGRRDDADLIVAKIEEQIKRLGWGQIQVSEHLYHVTEAK